ncbi:syndecan-3-like [Anopheles nili]|uniref:syndecan-3-like n=1 Tax=Anopheles nili TaxID=185578 RepID=UPI00237B3641|nr:syndecan-3-like [Anopheles nili]XP_053681341.1 syndecan-3-like [Anopheles nili]
MPHQGKTLLLVLLVSLVANQWVPVCASGDFFDDILSIFFDSDSESDSESGSESVEMVNVGGKNATIHVTCDACVLNVVCPNCISMSTENGPMVKPMPSSPAPPPPMPATNGDATTTVAGTTTTTTTSTTAGTTTAPANGAGTTSSTTAAPDMSSEPPPTTAAPADMTP